jgi:acetyltransferase-like isoleucine patch superfamily enzyme
MTTQDNKSTKAKLLQLIEEIWANDSFILQDTERTKKFRPDIIERLLSSVMTDDERAVLHNLPVGCRMREGAKIISPEKLVCGEYVWIGENAVLDASGGLEIGSHTSITVNTTVWSHTSSLSNIMMSNQPSNPYIKRAKTKIGSGCFISGVVYPGITIGDRCIVTPLSVVTKDLPSDCIAGGNPAKIISEIDESKLKKMLAAIGIQN